VATAKQNLLGANLNLPKWLRPSKKCKGFLKIKAVVCDWAKNHKNMIHSLFNGQN
jgi:hypothetical protein